MRASLGDFGTFLHDVFWRWQSWAGGGGIGGAVMVFIMIWERASPEKAMGKPMFFSIVIGAFLLGAVFLAWRAQYHAHVTAQQEIARLKSHADIKGMIHDVNCIGTDQNNTMLMMNASIVNESPEVSPTIRSFRCELEMDSGIIEASIADGTDESIGIINGVFCNLGHQNNRPLVKHCHRQGWIRFLFYGAIVRNDGNGKLRLFVTDGSGTSHLVHERDCPWVIKYP